MKVVFFGTSSFAASILEHLLSQKNIQIVAIVTRLDKPRGRSLALQAPPVKEKYLSLNSDIPLYQPPKASTPEFAEILKSYDADLFVVVAYGEIIKSNILEIPKKGCINIHASLLPKYRGAAPIHRALMDGVKETGITIIEMTPAMDAGDMLHIEKMAVTDEMTFEEVEKKLCELACIAITKTIEAFEKGSVTRIPQEVSEVTFASKLLPQDEIIDWNKDAYANHYLIRSLSPKPGAFCKIKIGNEEKRLKIKRSRVIPDKTGAPGSFLLFDKTGWIIACKEGSLQILEVQLEGKKAMPIEDFMKGLNQPISLVF